MVGIEVITRLVMREAVYDEVGERAHLLRNLALGSNVSCIVVAPYLEVRLADIIEIVDLLCTRIVVREAVVDQG